MFMLLFILFYFSLFSPSTALLFHRRLGGMEEEKKDLERQNEKLKRSLELKEVV